MSFSDPVGTTDEPDSPIADLGYSGDEVPAADGVLCIYAGKTYSVGSEVCMVGKVHRCYADSGGTWSLKKPETDCTG
jgi:hypothetical protein